MPPKYNQGPDENISIDVSKYRVEVAYASPGKPEYIGMALPGADTAALVWQIKKFIYSGSDIVQVLWADKNNNFDKSWDLRATYTYG